jgi:hypothetical protein
MAANVSATPEQIAKVFEVLKGFMPNGAMIEKIRHETRLVPYLGGLVRLLVVCLGLGRSLGSAIRVHDRA